TVDQVVAEIEQIFETFAADGPSDDEVDATRRRLLNSLETTMREPFHWMELLQYHDLHGRSLDDAATAADAYKAVTAGQVRDTFRKYCVPQRSFRVVSVPSEAATTAPADTPATAPAAHH